MIYDALLSIVVSITGGLVLYFITKWLDRHHNR